MGACVSARLDVWISGGLMDNNPGGVSEVTKKCRRVSEGCQRARCGLGNFEVGRGAVSCGKFEPYEGFQPGNAGFVLRGGG